MKLLMINVLVTFSMCAFGEPLLPGRDVVVDLGEGTGMEFRWIPALQGWCGKYEVTNGEHHRFNAEHYIPDYRGYSLSDDRQPVGGIGREDAKGFLNWMNANCQLPSGYKATLPSRREWMTVAQCGDNRTYPWGYSLPPDYGNYYAFTINRWSGSNLSIARGIEGYRDAYKVSCPVEKSGRNDWGLYGVGGNVAELTEEVSDDGGYVYRGGSWNSSHDTFLLCSYESMTRVVGTGNRVAGFRVFLRKIY